ncbi:MAG TPA: TonB-dependent siderophore receptor, partial [Gemmatimonadaceae bacterium]|nr:TonB-dependent siderophore receptor [Gemmatimonadaceae bacterium]
MLNLASGIARCFLATAICCTIFVTSAGAQTAADSTRSDSISAAKIQKLQTVRVDAKSRLSRYSPGYSRTATKLPSLPRDVPQSLTTVNAALVKDQGMKSMAEVVRYIPGITMGQGEGNRDQPTIRGNGTTADFFIDGVRDDAQYFRDLYNLERVEALKGSNAMVFGRGGGGGILNRVTKEAQWRTSREVAAEAGSFGSRRVSTDLQQNVSPLLAARLNSVYENSDLFRNGSSLERSGFNPTLTFASRSRATQLAVGYEHFADRRTADRGIPSFQGKPVDTDPSTFFGSAKQSRARIGVNSASATLSHDAGAVQVRNNTRFADYDKFYQNVYPGAVDASGANVSLSAYNHAIGRKNIFNQTDFTWTAGAGAVTHDLLAGVEVGRQTTTNFRQTGYFGSAAFFLVPVNRPVYENAVTFRQSSTDADNSTVVGTGSAYVQDQMSITRHVKVLAGARLENFAIRFRDNRANVERRRTDHMISPRAGLVVKPSELVSVYASYSLSFLPGSGDQFTTLTEVTSALRPERFTNYEAGIKWDAFDRLALSAAAYRLDRTNTRAVDPLDPRKSVQTGAQRSQGIELSAVGSVTSAWEIAGGYARQEASIVHATAASPAGASVPLVPSRTFSLWNKYSIVNRFGAGLGVVRQAEVFAAIDNKVTLPAFTRFDGALFAGIGFGLRAQLNVENLFDVKYYP